MKLTSQTSDAQSFKNMFPEDPQPFIEEMFHLKTHIPFDNIISKNMLHLLATPN